MIYYLRGKLIERKPTYAIIESGGIGYQVFISLFTYSQLENKADVQILTHFIVKEDGHYLYGFSTEDERHLFVSFISVSGVGPNTARLILSSLEPDIAREAIISGDDQVFRKVKGVGPKTAQRIIIDLRDKFTKESNTGEFNIKTSQSSSIKSEAISALISLGFGRQQVETVMRSIPTDEQIDIPVEELIKTALKKLA
ncbi:MAG: Holliday junction branch migration protein RuvA [Bacteroidota bacterium]|nr:Holliday junction branch migration protein RuvA [Bacteroidota bacterium]